MRSLLLPIRPELWAVAVFSTIINVLVLVVPLYTMHLYDKVLPGRSVPTLVSLTLAAAVLMAGMALLDSLRARIQIRAATAIEEHLAGRVFETVMARMARNAADGSAQAFADIREMRTFLTGPAVPAFVDAPWALPFLVLLFALNPLVGGVSLAGAAVLVAVAWLSDVGTRGRLAEGGQSSIRAEAFAASCVRAAEAGAALGMAPALGRVWRDYCATAQARIGGATETSATLMCSAKAIRQVLQMLILATGAWLVLRQEMAGGTMFAAAMLASRALSPVEQSLGAWRGFVSARQAAGRLISLLPRSVPAAAAPPPRPEARLTLRRVSAPVPGGAAPFLSAIDLQARGGEIVAVVGPSGAGKSVLGRVMVGLVRPLAGEVRLGGLDMAATPAEARGRFVGYLPQDLQLVDGPVRAVISRFDAAPDDAAVMRAARLAGIHDLVMGLPLGYDTPLGPGGAVLSGGQRQRLALARALYGDPPLVVLDEPDASLDAAGAQALQTCLRRLREDGQAVVVISHRAALLTMADRVIELEGGRIRMQGPRDRVLADIRGRSRSAPASEAAQ